MRGRNGHAAAVFELDGMLEVDFVAGVLDIDVSSVDFKHKVLADESCIMDDRFHWRVGDRWRPDAKIADAWRRAVGPKVKYCFLKDFYDCNGRIMSLQFIEDLQGKQCVGEVE